jgi:hypothetical protein
MDFHTKPKIFECPLHPKEFIHSIHLDGSSEANLLCIRCLMARPDKLDLNTLQSINQYIESASKSYDTFRDIELPEGKDEFFSLISLEAIALNRLEEHICQQKTKVNKFYDKVMVFFIEAINKSRQKVFRSLDEQINVLKHDFTVCKNLYEKFYEKSSEKFNPTLDGLVEQMNSCFDIDELKQFLQTINIDIQHAKSLNDCPNITEKIMADLEDFAINLESKLSVSPSSIIPDDESKWNLYLNKIDDLITPLSLIEDQMVPI